MPQDMGSYKSPVGSAITEFDMPIISCPCITEPSGAANEIWYTYTGTWYPQIFGESTYANDGMPIYAKRLD